MSWGPVAGRQLRGSHAAPGRQAGRQAGRQGQAGRQRPAPHPLRVAKLLKDVGQLLLGCHRRRDVPEPDAARGTVPPCCRPCPFLTATLLLLQLPAHAVLLPLRGAHIVALQRAAPPRAACHHQRATAASTHPHPRLRARHAPHPHGPPGVPHSTAKAPTPTQRRTAALWQPTDAGHAIRCSPTPPAPRQTPTHAHPPPRPMCGMHASSPAPLPAAPPPARPHAAPAGAPWPVQTGAAAAATPARSQTQCGSAAGVEGGREKERAKRQTRVDSKWLAGVEEVWVQQATAGRSGRVGVGRQASPRFICYLCRCIVNAARRTT